jgi:hypothetical protein
MCFRLFQSLGAPDHVVNVDASQSDRNRPLRLGQRWPYDVVDQRGIRERERLIVLGGRRCAQNVVSRNACSLAGELIAAMRASDPFEDAVPYQSLQDRLEVARR